MPPKSEAFYKKQREKDKKKKRNEGALIAEEHAAHKAAGGGTGRARKDEANAVAERLAPLGLRPAQVPADGNCLFSSLRHQWALLGAPPSQAREAALPKAATAATAMDVRRFVAGYMRAHPDEYAPFVAADTSDGGGAGASAGNAAAPFSAYCDALAASPAQWGSQVELRAAADAFGVAVRVVQAAGTVDIVGSAEAVAAAAAGGPCWTVVFLRSQFVLGAHFNATVPVVRPVAGEGARGAAPAAAGDNDGDNNSGGRARVADSAGGWKTVPPRTGGADAAGATESSGDDADE